MRCPFFWAVLACVLLGACRSGDDAVSMERVVLTQEKKPKGKPKQPPEWFDAEIAAAVREREAGRIREALERAYAARDQDPEEEHDALLTELIEALNRDVLELETLDAWVEVVKEPIAFGEPVRIRIHLRNDGPRAIRIPARQKGTSGSLFTLELTRREYDVRAHVVTSRRRVLTPLVGDLEIPPGGSAEQVLSIEEAGNSKPLEGFRVYTIGGVLRPTVVEVGGLRRWEALRLKEASLRSFRPNYEHLMDDPVARIGQALEKRAAVHLLTASALVPADGRRAAVDRLVDALRGDRPIDWAIFASLQYLTQVELGRDAGAWRAWWPRVRETFFAPAPEKPDPDRPVFSDD